MRLTRLIGSVSFPRFGSLSNRIWIKPYWTDAAIPFPSKDVHFVWDLAVSFASFYSCRLPNSILDDICFYKRKDDLQPIRHSVPIASFSTTPEDPIFMKRRMPSVMHVDFEGVNLQVPTDGCLLVKDIIGKLSREYACCSHLNATSISIEKGRVILNSMAQISVELDDYGTLPKPLVLSYQLPVPSLIQIKSSEYGEI